ncbi:unnamed protein product [Effrenium voratum]|uniref:Uncharacterized protein n=1 Tax=Effrenium voratum TaxID=2562239 RepID=A0AA36IW59_9DINO|nr:unnamed protein product [Effrenium voratum]
MAMAFSKWARICEPISRLCKAIGRIYKDAPTLCLIATSTIALVVLLVALFSSCVARLMGARGALTVDLILFWLFARLVARVLMFPGSLKLFQRSTEANYRIEIARHYMLCVRQLWHFLRHAGRVAEVTLRGVTLEGLEKSCTAISTLASSLRTQQQHEARLSKEQTQARTWNAGCRRSRCG